jgi:hypothetical protein
MSTKTEGQHSAEFLVSEAPGTRSRDQVTVTVPANTTLQGGYVLGRNGGSSKYEPYDNAASDGTQQAAGILYETLVNDTGSPVDKQATIINTDAEVREADLVWLDEDNDAAAGLADLLALGIKAR